MDAVRPAPLADHVRSLRETAGRLYHIANKIVTTEYALELRSIAAALDAQADRVADVARGPIDRARWPRGDSAGG